MPTKDPPPLLNLTALRAMESDFHDATPVRNFVQDFISIWNDRYARLLDASADEDRRAAINVLMGIKVSSVMLGADQLKSVAEDIELRVRKGSARVSDSLLIALHDCGERTVRELNDVYLQPAAPRHDQVL